MGRNKAYKHWHPVGVRCGAPDCPKIKKNDDITVGEAFCPMSLRVSSYEIAFSLCFLCVFREKKIASQERYREKKEKKTEE